MKARLLVTVCLALLAVFPAASEDLVPLRRFALVAGSNNGGVDRVRLKYAESDARAFASVMQELGGVRADDLVLALNPSLTRFQAAFARVQEMMSLPRAGEERREFLIYYSGHSDDEGLILGAERLSWEELRERLTDIPADVKVAILDSCSSGSLTRAKGGVARPAFLFDASMDMKGHAYLTSSSAEEAAQESDRIGASFFTHFLISGLRGAADTVGDGVVTLNEAYAFAFQETLSSTEKTQYGPQHPAYDINLTGSGDLVLTDLRAASAKLRVADDVGGRLYIRDSRGLLAVELDKAEGQSIELGLSPGSYKIVVDGASGRLGTTLRISAHQRATLSKSSLRPVPADRTTARGSGGAPGSGRSEGTAESDPVAAAAAMGAAVGAAVGTAVATAIATTVDAVGGGGRGAAEPGPVVEPAAAADPGSEEPDPALESAPAPSAAPTTRQLEPRTEAFHLTLLPEISSGVFASQENHVVTINLLVGTSSSSRGFEVGGLANFEASDMSGFQGAGLANVVLGDTAGFQAAGLVNVVGGETRFVQTAGLFNASLGTGRGAQIAGLGNWSSGAFSGAQVGGLANIATGDLRGAQVSGLVNWGRTVSGPQISVVNIADTVSGAQVGLVNIAGHVSGVQVGLVNVSQDIDGVPIGLVSIVEKGRQKIDVWYDTDGGLTMALSLGSRLFYTVFSAGWVPESQPVLWSLGLGMGFRAALGKLWADFDVSVLTDQGSFGDISSPGAVNVHPRLRAALGLPVFGESALEVGVSVKVTVPDNPTVSTLVYSPALFFGIQL